MVAIPQQQIIQQLAAGDVGNTDQKGDALEEVVRTTLCLFSGVTLIYKNAEDAAGSCEIDLLLSNNCHPDGLPFLPPYLVIECKNWAAPVNTATCRAFTSKLRAFGMKFGMLVAASGITGDPATRTAAHAHLREEFLLGGLIVLVVTRDELEALSSTDDLLVLLKTKFGRFVMGMGGL